MHTVCMNIFSQRLMTVVLSKQITVYLTDMLCGSLLVSAGLCTGAAEKEAGGRAYAPAELQESIPAAGEGAAVQHMSLDRRQR